MTNAILPGMTHSETPYPAPTPGFGAASRGDEGKTASAKPRRGLLLDKFKTPVAVLLGALVSLAHGAVTITSPVDYATVTVMPSVMRDFRSTFATGKKWSFVNSSTLGSAQRIEWETACRASQTAVALSWSGTGSTMCTVKVYRAKDGAEVFSATSTTGKASFPDAEIGRNYRWTVTYNSTTAEGHFYVNRIAPRMMNSFGGIGNSRDLGGWTTDSGKVVRQGLVFRSEEWDFVDSATGLYRDGCEPKSYWADTVGVNLDIDLRAKEWVNSYYMPANDSRAALDKSPLDLDKNIRRFRTEDAGTSVGAFPEANGFNAGGEVGGDPTVYTADQFKRAIAYAVHQFGNRDNYPILFHCSQGTDRTGALAYLLSGLLGVSEDDRDLDFVFSYAWDADEYKLSMWDMDTIRDTVNKCSGATFKDKCVTYVKNCYAMTTSPKLSATDAENDIATFRSMMLEDPEEAATDPSGDEESFVYENYYWMCDGAGGTLSDGMSYWYKDPEGETKWPADQQNIVNNPNAAVYLWPTAAHPYAYPVARAFTIGKLVSRISYGGTVGLVPGEPTTYEPNPSPKGYFTNTGHGVTDRPLWTHQSGVASAERLRMYLEAGTGTGSVQIWTNARLNLSAFESVYENVYIDFPAGKCDGATVCFYGLNGSQGESTVAWIQGGQDGTAQNLIVSNALMTVQRADKTSGVAGALNLEFDLGAANETTSTMMTVNGGFKMNAGSTIRVNAGGKPAGTYRLLTVGSGKTLTIPTATVRGAKVVGCAPGLAGTVALSGNVLSFTIVKTTATVTLGDHPHLAAAWTGGDGSVTNAVEGASFEVAPGTENVKVFFTADSGWEIVGDAVVELGTVTENIVFGGESGYKVPMVVPEGYVFYLDYDASTGTFTNAVRECTLVTSETRTLENGWYAVMDEVVIPEGERLVVQGTAHLILCDGAKLNVEKPGKDNAGVNVSGDASLVIYGQTAGTGVLTATGGDGGAGIGGGKRGAVGTVTINGGTVMATGGDFGAGIGGGDYGAGGTVTINGGTVTAAGEWGGSGIGGGYTGACGVVTINGGTVTAMGTSGGAGIGGGGWVAGGIVTINGGTVTAIGASGGVGIGGTGPGCGTVRIGGGSVYVEGAGEVIATSEEPESGSVQISGGIFNIPIPAKWCAPRFALSVNPDPATRNTYRYTVVLGKKVTIGDYPYLLAVWTSGDGTMTNEVEGSSFYVSSGTENVSVHFATEPNSVYSIEEDTVLLGTVMDDIVFGEGNEYTVPRIYFGDIAYLDWDGSRMTNAILSKYDYTLVTPNTQEMVDGWYVVATNIERGGIAVKGSVNLFIADGCEFKVECIDAFRPGIEVLSGNQLTVYGKMDGTGVLSTRGCFEGAGIGGGEWDAVGTVTINGGTVVATGGDLAAGIGGGREGAGGVVTINGGTVSAMGGSEGAGIGGGGIEGAGGVVTINGGTVFAKGDGFGAGIGGGQGGAGGTVTITGGIVTAIGGVRTVDIGGGAVVEDDIRIPGVTATISGGAVKASSMDGDIAISGGIFGTEPEDDWLAANCINVKNPDETTKADYPWMVMQLCAVTVGNFPRGIVAWTSGDGSVTNVIDGTGFKVAWGSENVKVIFTAKPGYELVGDTVVDLGTVTVDVTFGSGSGYKLPSVRTLPVEYVDADGVVREKAFGEFTKVTASTKKLADGKWYAVIDDVTLTNSLPVEGSAHLILCDWATLAITNSTADAAISVGSGASLTIYGQTADTGRLTVSGGNAGIGGKTSGVCGAIAIHGGTISASAMSNKYCAGIGSGALGSGGSVTITGGRITAQGGTGAEDIGSGANAKSPCAVAISGGVFARALKDAWLAPGFAAVTNKDVATAAEYPYAVLATYSVSWNGNADKMSIHVQIDGKTVTDNPATVAAGEVVEFIVLPKPGYEYAAAPEGWSLRTDGGICNRFEVVDDSIEVKIPDPTGESITYTITYFDYGEWIDGFEPVTEYTFETETFNLPVAGDIAPRMGGMFQCWTNEVGETVSEVVQGTEGNLNFYAVWKSAGADPIQAIIGDKVDGFVDLSSEEQKAVYDNVRYLYSQFLDVDRTEAWIATVYGDGSKVPAAKFAATTEDLVNVSFKYGLPIMAPPVTIHVTTAKEDLGFTFAITDGDKDAVSVKAANLYGLVKYTASLDDEFHVATEAEVKFDKDADATFTARFVEGPAAGFMKAELIVPDPAED